MEAIFYLLQFYLNPLGNNYFFLILTNNISAKHYTQPKEEDKGEDKQKKTQRSTLFKKTLSSDISKITKKITESIILQM